MICPICKQEGVRRSRRQSGGDFILGLVGIYPWRCRSCSGRFHARLMSLSDSLRAHCPICGNHDLKRIGGEHVDGTTAFLWRMLHVPALRCEPCRYKYFSILPMQHHDVEENVPVSSTE